MTLSFIPMGKEFMKKHILLTSAVALSLAACAKHDDPKPANPAPATVQAPAPEPAPAPAETAPQGATTTPPVDAADPGEKPKESEKPKEQETENKSGQTDTPATGSTTVPAQANLKAENLTFRIFRKSVLVELASDSTNKVITAKGMRVFERSSLGPLKDFLSKHPTICSVADPSKVLNDKKDRESLQLTGYAELHKEDGTGVTTLAMMQLDPNGLVVTCEKPGKEPFTLKELNASLKGAAALQTK